MSKNVAVFVDVANIFYAAKAAGVDIDYVTLLKASSAGRDLVRAYAYTGLDPDNENQRNFHDFLRRHGYKVVSKDIRKYGDGKVKANLDIELVVDMMKTARNLDIAIVVSGDGDFAPAIRAVQEQGVRVEVVSFRGNTSSDLMDVADQFTDITQIAKVEKGSSRSGRRVATDDEDLSMTEVPDKQSEGTGERSRGRGRTRRTPAAASTGTTRGRGRVAAASDAAEGPIVVLPGEKLSRVAAVAAEPAEAAASDMDIDEAPEAGDEVAVAGGADRGTDEAAAEEGRRRRRRRGGRGRGRGRGREEGPFVEEGVAAPGRVAAEGEDAEELEDEAPSPARRPASAFGSVWDSQIGIAPSLSSPVVSDDEDFDEPAVPEYLIAERRQRDGRRGGRPAGGRGGRGGAYAAALDRERFGGGRGSTPSRFAEPPPRDREPSFNRDDRRDRGRGDRPPFRQAPRPAPRGSGDEPWSEVPPEIEAMLRAQLGSRPAPAPRRDEPAMSSPATEAPPAVEAEATTKASAPRRGRKPAGGAATSDADSGLAAGTGTRRAPVRRSRATSAEAPAEASSVSSDESAATDAAPSATRRRTTTRTGTRTASRAKASAADGAAAGEGDAAPSETPKRRTTRRKAEPAA